MTELLRLVRQSVGHFLKSFVLLLQLLHRRIKERSKTGGKRNNPHRPSVLRHNLLVILSTLITLPKTEENDGIVHDTALFMMAVIPVTFLLAEGLSRLYKRIDKRIYA